MLIGLSQAQIANETLAVGQIIEGMTYQLYNQSVPVQQCVNNATDVYDEFKLAYGNLTISFDYVQNAFALIQRALNETENVISECEGLEQFKSDLEKID